MLVRDRLDVLFEDECRRTALASELRTDERALALIL
jgi:hypothetical protein